MEEEEDKEKEVPPYLPLPSDIPRVQQMLFQKRLPSELVLDIMAMAHYSPKRRLIVQDDPLHPDNRDELVRYLDECWQLLVRCDMMAKVVGLKNPWRESVPRCVVAAGQCQHYEHGDWYNYVPSRDNSDDHSAGMYVFQWD